MGNLTYRTEIDYDYLDSIKDDQDALFDYIDKEFVQEKYKDPTKSVQAQCRVMMRICEKLGLKPLADQFIFVMTDYRFVNNQAVAGAGKTTFCQLRAIKEKFLHGVDGKQILCIAYNKDAAKDMADKHRSLVDKYNNYIWGQIKAAYGAQIRTGKLKEKTLKDKNFLDTYIDTYTFHSFAYTWIDEYRDQFQDLYRIKDGDFLADDKACASMMGNAVEVWKDDFPALQSKLQGKALAAFITNLIALYQMRAETMSYDLADLVNSGVYKDVVELTETSENILSIFTIYEKLKKRRQLMDFSDILTTFYVMLHEKPEVLDRIRLLYKYVIFDEFQDVSKIMLETMHFILDGDVKEGGSVPAAKDMKLTIIADVDQCLYEFRGVSVQNSLEFKDKFGAEETKIVSMAANRRCLAPIVDLSAEIIEPNEMRIKKPIRPLRGNSILEEDEGKPFEQCKHKAVQLKGYKSESDYVKEIISDIKKMSSIERGETAIIYRNKASSIYVAMELFKAGIPTDVVKGIAPFKDTYSRTIMDTLNLLYMPNSFTYAKSALYKILPKYKGVTSSYYQSVCNQEQKYYEKNKDADTKPFWEYNFGNPYNYQTFKDRINKLHQLSNRVKRGESMLTIVNDVISCIEVNSLRFSENMPDEKILPLIRENFLVDMSFKDFRKSLTAKLEGFEEDSESLASVTMTTFHSTKGLEWNTVYIIDMEDSVFPGRELAECKGDQYLVDQCMESCRRLFYVAVTRARNNLICYTSESNPSRFTLDLSPKYMTTELFTAIQKAKSQDYSHAFNYKDEEVDLVKSDYNYTNEYSTDLEGKTKGDFAMAVSQDVYLKTLDIASFDYGSCHYKGWYQNGFVHLGDYAGQLADQQAEEEKRQRAEQLINELNETKTEDALSDIDLDMSLGLGMTTSGSTATDDASASASSNSEFNMFTEDVPEESVNKLKVF